MYGGGLIIILIYQLSGGSISGSGDFELLDGSDFLLLDFSNFLLLGT